MPSERLLYSHVQTRSFIMPTALSSRWGGESNVVYVSVDERRDLLPDAAEGCYFEPAFREEENSHGFYVLAVTKQADKERIDRTRQRAGRVARLHRSHLVFRTTFFSKNGTYV